MHAMASTYSTLDVDSTRTVSVTLGVYAVEDVDHFTYQCKRNVTVYLLIMDDT